MDVRKLRHNLGGGKNSGSTAGCIREQYPCLVVVIVVVLTIINQIRSNVGKALLQLNPETRPVIFPQHTPYGHTKYAPNHAHTMRGKIRCLPASSRRISLHTSTSSSRYLWRLPIRGKLSVLLANLNPKQDHGIDTMLKPGLFPVVL